MRIKMKSIVITAILLASSIVNAQNVMPASSAQQESSSASTANNLGVAGNNNVTFTSPGDITSRVEYSGSQTVKNTPSVSGPNLTTSNDTCMGATSGSVNVAGFGLGGGATYVDENCKRLKNSRELWNMGMKAASLALMCNDSENLIALEVTGYICPKATSKAAVSQTNTYPTMQIKN
jgi:hypothetical protein